MFSQPLDNYYDRYASNPDEEVRGGTAMHYEVLRLNTFKDWPSSSAAWPSTLARVGFYYEGNGDETRCFSCKGTIKRWQNSDDPTDEHLRLHANCPFMLGRDTRNVAFDPPEGSLPPQSTFASQTQHDSALNIADTVDPMIGTPLLNHESDTMRPAGHHESDTMRTVNAAFGAASNGASNANIPAMKREKVRLKTFSTWPHNNPVRPASLAKAGFYYLGNLDRVKCAFCLNVLRNWVEGDNPDTEHQKYYPDCSFVLGMDVGNVSKERDYAPIEDEAVTAFTQQQTRLQQATQLGIITDRPRHPEHALEVYRLRTFRDFPRDSPVKPEVLAKAGFFFTGNGDCVRCFYCDMGLRHWEPNDDPWEEHARWYPRCSYMQTVKGENYIQEIQRKYGRAAADPIQTQISPNAGDLNVISGSESSWVERQLNSSAAKTVLEMGYPRTIVRRALERRHAQHGLEFISVENLLESIFEIEASGENDSPAPLAAAEAKLTPLAEPATQMPGQTETATSPTQSMDEYLQVSEESVLEENRQLKEQRVCKVCMDKDVNIVFLPCGHLCCCSNCAPALRDCPICRQLVRGTVRIFLS